MHQAFGLGCSKRIHYRPPCDPESPALLGGAFSVSRGVNCVDCASRHIRAMAVRYFQ